MSKLEQLKEQGILTQNEKIVLEYLLNTGWYEDDINYSDVTFNIIEENTNISTAQLRGVLSSLTKKQYVIVDYCQDAGVSFIYPTEKSFTLR